jgi:hypothetical protein
VTYGGPGQEVDNEHVCAALIFTIELINIDI